MEGQVYVPYMQIMGINLDAEPTSTPIGGSSNETGGDDSVGIGCTVFWRLPGGIQLMGTIDAGGAWGYIRGRDQQTEPYSDELFCNYLRGDLGYDIGGAPNYVVADSDQQQVRDTINSMIAKYIIRVQALSGEVGYDWTAFKNYYNIKDPKCIAFPII